MLSHNHLHLCTAAQYMLLFLILAVILTDFEFYMVTHSYSSDPFLCTLVQTFIVFSVSWLKYEGESVGYRYLVSSHCLFTYPCRAVLDKYGKEVAKSTLFFLLSSCGMYIAAPAYLPSSFSMYCGMIIVGAWLQKNYEVCCPCETM